MRGKDGREQIRIQLVQLRQQVTDVALALEVQRHVDCRRGIVRVDDHDGFAQVLPQADGRVDGHRGAAGAAFRRAEDDDAASRALVDDGLRRRDALAEHLAERAEEIVALDRLNDERPRAREHGHLGCLQRIRRSQEDHHAPGRAPGQALDHACGIDIPQVLVDEDHVRGQALRSRQRQVRLRDPVVAVLAHGLQRIAHLRAQLCAGADEKNSKWLTGNQARHEITSTLTNEAK